VITQKRSISHFPSIFCVFHFLRFSLSAFLTFCVSHFMRFSLSAFSDIDLGCAFDFWCTPVDCGWLLQAIVDERRLIGSAFAILHNCLLIITPFCACMSSSCLLVFGLFLSIFLASVFHGLREGLSGDTTSTITITTTTTTTTATTILTAPLGHPWLGSNAWRSSSDDRDGYFYTCACLFLRWLCAIHI